MGFKNQSFVINEYLHRPKKETMFGLFKKKTEEEKLQEKYKTLMADYHRLSTTDRTASDKAYAQADEIAKQLDALSK